MVPVLPDLVLAGLAGPEDRRVGPVGQHAWWSVPVAGNASATTAADSRRVARVSIAGAHVGGKAEDLVPAAADALRGVSVA